MRTECLEHHYVYESPMPVQRLVLMVADKCQVLMLHFSHDSGLPYD
jgi:hypothetical protein